MRRVISLVAAGCGFAAVYFSNMQMVSATAPAISISSDLQRLPRHGQILAESLPMTDNGIHVSYRDAVNVAESEFGLTDSDVDNTSGVIAARMSVRGAPSLKREKAWVVTFDVAMHGHGPVMGNVLFSRLCVVIDAETGQYEYAYQATPTS